MGVKRKDELQDWLPKCPVDRTKKALLQAGMSETGLDGIEQEVLAEVEDALKEAREAPFPDVSTLADHVFVEKPEA